MNVDVLKRNGDQILLDLEELEGPWQTKLAALAHQGGIDWADLHPMIMGLVDSIVERQEEEDPDYTLEENLISRIALAFFVGLRTGKELQ